MKKMEQFKALFPLEGMITQEIIDKGKNDVSNPERCIGALTFQAALGENVNLFDKMPRWMVRASSWVNEIDNHSAPMITTTEGINFMHVRHPQAVTFILQESQL